MKRPHVLFLSLSCLLLLAAQAAQAAPHTKRIPPRQSCGDAANEYCVDVSGNEVGCETRAAEWKICAYVGDEKSFVGDAAFLAPSPQRPACLRQCATSWESLTDGDGNSFNSEEDCAERRCRPGN